MNWVELLKLFQDNPEYMLIAFIAIIVMLILIKVLSRNKIGEIKSKNTTIEQSGKKGNSINKIDSEEDTKIVQKD